MRHRYQESSKPPIKACKILYILSLARPALAKLRGHCKPYDQLIDVILAIGPDDKLPVGKVVQEQFGINAGKFRKWLDTLHQDFIAAISVAAGLLQYSHIEHIVHVQGRREVVSLLCQLPVIPRVDEGLELWFLMGETGDGAYYVEDVRYELSDDTLRVIVSVRPGYFDAYFWQLRASAKVEGKLPYQLEEEMGEYGTKEYLRTLYEPAQAAASHTCAPRAVTKPFRQQGG